MKVIGILLSIVLIILGIDMAKNGVPLGEAVPRLKQTLYLNFSPPDTSTVIISVPAPDSLRVDSIKQVIDSLLDSSDSLVGKDVPLIEVTEDITIIDK